MLEFWGEPISVYSREQAIEDGILTLVPEAIAREAGFKHPVALSLGVEAVLSSAERNGEDYTGRLWDVLSVGFMRFMAALHTDRARFERGDTRVDYVLRFAGYGKLDLYLTVNAVEGFTVLLRGED